MGESEIDFLAKVIIVGDSGVGKTVLLTRYCNGPFEDTYVATIGLDFKLKTVELEGTKIGLQIWDTAGQERFRNITQTYYRGASAIVLTYQINKIESFQSLGSWISQIEASNEQDICKVLVGTKIDLEAERQVSHKQGQDFALKHNMLFEEVSAKTGINVEQLFQKMVREIKRKRTYRRRDSSQGTRLLNSGVSISKNNCRC